MRKQKHDLNPKTDYRPKTDTLVYALGGLGEVGKNMYCVEHNDEIIIIDAGVMFPGDNLLGVDYVIPDYDYLIRNKHKVKALFITHGHEDHIGGIPFLLQAMDIPVIYASTFASYLIRKKLEERKMLNKVKIVEITDDSRIATEHFTVGFFRVVHSTPDAFGIIINTPNGNVVTTGDFKFDLTPVGDAADYQKMAFIGASGATLLLSDSTNSEVEDFSLSEKKVTQQLKEITSQAKGRLIVATFASNIIRVQQIFEAAIADGRKIAIFGRSMVNVVEIGKHLGHIDVPEDAFLKPHQLKNTPADQVCIVCTGSQGEPFAALSRVANGSHRDITIMPGDTVVFSSSAIPGNTHSINKTVNSLTRAGANVLTSSVLSSLHTTGHASSEEQKLLLQLIKPKHFMPMHGEHKMLKIHGQTAVETGMDPKDVFICSNGEPLILRDEKVYRSNTRVQTDDIYVDGKDTSGLATAVIKDRRLLSDNGLVAVVVSIDSRQNKILCRPSIVSRGYVFVKENQKLLKDAELLVYEELKKELETKTTFGGIKNTIRKTLTPYFQEQEERVPIVIPVILNRTVPPSENHPKRLK